MPSASALRSQIEHSLERRFPSALTPVSREIHEKVSTGIEAIDSMLDGGLPLGAISELTGPNSSGRTSLATAFVAACMREDHVCAWVDVSDSFDPESAAAGGITLSRLLWVRCTQSTVQSAGKPWRCLDQALRATDLLLQAGGFASIVLDLGDVAPEHGCRIPLATWFRFRQAADRVRTALVVLAKQPYAQSSAAAVLSCSTAQVEDSSKTVLRGIRYRVERERQRSSSLGNQIRKPPSSTWSAPAAWQQERCP
ncbi:MAG TPA: hypothetical protein VK716_12045 [Terracidiphilus sp.]|jgi:hypothetical protein|nr:hypothetical protein [Terracidiphilus sp.]